MSRGDQRDRDRAKNLAKQQAKDKQKGKVGIFVHTIPTIHHLLYS